MKMRIKSLILQSISLVAFTSKVLASNALDDQAKIQCASQCDVLTTCQTLYVKPGESYSVYPPKGDMGKCLCQFNDGTSNNYQSYNNCMVCRFQVKKPNTSFNTLELIKTCNDLLNIETNVSSIVNSPIPTATVPTSTISPNSSQTTMGSLNTQANNNQNINSDDNSSGGSSTKYICIGVVLAVAVAGIIGFVVYNKKQKARPESMPFFGGSTSSPHFATLNSPKESTGQFDTMNMVNSNTLSYNNQPNSGYYDSSATAVTTNATINDPNYYDQYANTGSMAPVATDAYANAGYDQYGQTQGYDQYNQGAAAGAYDQYNQGGYDQANQDYADPMGSTSGLVATAAAVGTAGAAAAEYDYNNNIQRRESMMNQENGESGGPAINHKSMIIGKTYSCAYKYDPQMDDELGLSKGDTIEIIEEYEDSWVKARNITTGKEGMAPKVCILGG